MIASPGTDGYWEQSGGAFTGIARDRRGRRIIFFLPFGSKAGSLDYQEKMVRPGMTQVEFSGCAYFMTGLLFTREFRVCS